ncbi:MAG: hypothetical protein IT378_04955 [Sandaracinaceae bacterium]|nr:hypothetical protein [Sandaracinaceae bacterium]
MTQRVIAPIVCVMELDLAFMFASALALGVGLAWSIVAGAGRRLRS